MTASAPRVIVVGAGAIGLFAALALAERGARVRVIDPAARIMAPAHDRSASARAAGLLGPFSESLNEPAGAHADLAAFGVAALARWRDRAQRLERAAGELFETPGALVLSQGGAYGGGALRLIDPARRSGSGAKLLSKKDLAKRFPAAQLRAEFGVLLDAEGQVRPGVTMVAALRALRALTGEEVRVAEARGLLVEAGRCVGLVVKPRALGDSEEERADAVVLAPGAWATGALIDAAPALAHVTPMKGHLFELEIPPGALPLPIRSQHVYALPKGNRLARVGASMEPGRRDHTVDQAVVEQLRDALGAVAPGLATGPILSSWAGVRAMSPDWGPLIGPSGPPGCFVASGHSRNGWLFAPITGELVAEWVLGAAPSAFAQSFRADRFG